MKFGTQIENTFGNNFGYRDIADLSCGVCGLHYRNGHRFSASYRIFFLGGREKIVYYQLRRACGYKATERGRVWVGHIPLPPLCEADILIDC